jgi:hypothetical protein
LAIAVGLLIGQLGGEQRGWIAGLFAGALIMLVRIAWPLRAERWFWIAIAVFAASDVLATMSIDWSFTEKWNGHTYSGLGVLDLGAMMAIVYGLYRVIYGPSAEVLQNDSGDLADYAQRDLDI